VTVIGWMDGLLEGVLYQPSGPSDAVGVWPVSDGKLPARDRKIGETLMRPRSDPPAGILRTADFKMPLQVSRLWQMVSARSLSVLGDRLHQ
jgi:hypothetical protein